VAQRDGPSRAGAYREAKPGWLMVRKSARAPRSAVRARVLAHSWVTNPQPSTLTTEEENPARLQLWLATTQAQGSQGSPYGRA